MSNKCEKCGQQNANIHVTDLNRVQHIYCMDCNNKETAALMGVENYTDFPRTYKSTDVDGVEHTFKIVKQIHPMGLLWEADEIGGEYHFALYADFEDDANESVHALFRKIDNGLSKKYIEKRQLDWQTLYSIKDDEVAGRLMWSEGEEGLPKVIIDGKSYTWEEFGRVLEGYEGFNFRMNIVEPGLDDD